jgi:hypothetical protein
MLHDLTLWGYQIGAVGIIVFTLAFLVLVRWWTDALGLILAALFFILSMVLMVTTFRLVGINPPGGIDWWRVFVFDAFGVVVWMAVGTFIWSQLFAPRVRRPRMTTRREHNEEADLADSRLGRDGDPDNGSGLAH